MKTIGIVLIAIGISTFLYFQGGSNLSASDRIKQTKDQVMKDLDSNLENVKNNIADLKLKLKTTSGKVSDDVKSQIENLQKDQDKLTDKMKELRTSSGAAWDELKKGIDEGIGKIGEGLKAAKQKLK